MGLYRLKLRKKFILLPSNSSLDFTWYQRLRLANIGREDFFDLHCRVGGHSRTSLSTLRICLLFALCHCCKQSLKKKKKTSQTHRQIEIAPSLLLLSLLKMTILACDVSASHWISFSPLLQAKIFSFYMCYLSFSLLVQMYTKSNK